MADFVKTKHFGLLDQKEFNHLKKRFDVANANSIPAEEYVRSNPTKGESTKGLRPQEFWFDYVGLLRAKEFCWKEICSETKDHKEREQLMFERWTGII